MQFFFMAALALTFAACSNEDDALTQQTDGQPADNMITITAQLAKSFAWGLDLMAAYTRSFSMSVTDGVGDQVYNIAQLTARSIWLMPRLPPWTAAAPPPSSST